MRHHSSTAVTGRNLHAKAIEQFCKIFKGSEKS
jgi:hypothetical protein